ncbi:kelch repeat and BTB domain-containing protein 2-like [Branchiostoma lanceolatum]|uniref:kelch repeat and BTB domain-containing protein 2-like n=1 Tax=Branchiostoma lanceolatum TaxID=7740 RepID=UPI003452AAD0
MAAAEQEYEDGPVRPRSREHVSYRHCFIDTIGDLQKAEVLQDVVLEVEGGRFPCHRLVLSAASPYFRAMFTSNMAESRQKTVVLQGLDAGIFGEILSYIYSGTLHVSLDKVLPLYQAADLLQLDYVRHTCSRYMAMNVERSTCVDLFKFADVFSVDIVLNRCLQCINMHFAKVASSEEFCSLSVNQLTKIISCDELDVQEETTVWEAVVRWVQHSREDRLHHLPSILPHIRFNLLTSDDTAAILEHPLVRENPASSELHTLALRGTSKRNMRVGMDAQEMILFFRAVEPCEDTREMLCMNPRSGESIKYSYIKDTIPALMTATVTSNNDIYILVEDSHDQVSVLRYNHLREMWGKKSSIHRDFPEHPMGDPIEYLFEVDGHLYYLAVHLMWVLRRKRGVTVVMKKYEWLTDRWQDCSKPRHDELRFFVAMTCGEQIFLLTNTEMHRYDPSQDLWSRGSPPRTIPGLCTAVAMGTEIFCTDNAFSKMAVYDVEADSWRELPGWSDPDGIPNRGDPILFAHEGQVCVLLEFQYQGDNDDDDDDELAQEIHVYNRMAGTWRDSQVTLPVPNDGYWIMGDSVLPVARIYMNLPDQDEHTRD